MKPNKEKLTSVDCQQVQHNEIIERYLNGRLSDDEVVAFEEHYLGCERCFRELRLGHALASELRRQPREAVEVSPLWRFRWRWALVSAVAGIVLVASLILLQIRSPQTSDEQVLDQLAAVTEYPPYLPSTIRATTPAMDVFQDAMREYTQSNYVRAAQLLEQSVRLDPEHRPSIFYLGISYLALGRVDDSIAWLSRLARAEPNPYSEESHWFLAKAYLKKRDLRSARSELQQVAAGGGMYAAEATQALEVLRRLQNAR